MMFNKGISLVIPIYNEDQIISESIDIFKNKLSSVTTDFEIILIDDGSIDSTPGIIDNLACLDKRIRTFHNKKNMGSGISLWYGFKHTSKEFVVSNFADRPFDLSDLKQIMPLFDSADIDFVIVTRKNRSANSLYRKITSYVNFLLIRLLFNIRVTDFQFVQVYKREILEKIRISSRHTFVAPEIIIKALSFGFRYREHESNFYPRPKGKSKYNNPYYIFISAAEIFLFFLRWKILRRKV